MPTSDDDHRAIGTDIDAPVGRMIGALARRQQVLVNDVHVLLDELEKDESDPTRLERLFRVDHLATLLGRSTASLGVLLDTSTHTMSDPLRLADVLQASVAGVHDFRRVVLPTAPELDVAGGVALDLVHLLTEIIDYSLASSSTDTVVDIDPPHVDGQTVIRVWNPALAMPDGSLWAINSMLRAVDPPGDDGQESMGLYVAGRLALRHGLTVQLARAEDGGTAAAIRIPATLVASSVTAPPSPNEYVGRHRRESVVESAITSLALLHHRAGMLRAGRR
ncbi:ATP-binding protein [Nocardioides piscis]|uniref:histidine kinase n=1 Tax=Nocardioides piscis TaxID=2714938 RepID=A0A6G7YHJ9_9ACTN|nr:ATP-binding protein [Nocardioides piscis]QIK76209.1 sensor histidine kinase [Nocardioides piscis]